VILKLVTPPATEPISLAEIKAHLRVIGSDEDSVITAYLQAAREMCELESRRAFVTQALALGLETWPFAWPLDTHVALPRPPLQSITSVTYIDYAGVTRNMPGADYIADTTSEPGRLLLAYNASWPSATLRPGPAITITFVAGYGNAGAVPERYKQAIRLLAGHFYENREQVVAAPGVTVAQMPDAVRSLLHIDRGWW
jgi:uncharacterized phiE125 gp8 family phage protein